MKVFISWSGPRSQKVASTLSAWLKMMVQASEPFVSEEDIQRGESWLARLSEELNQCAFAILCLTRESLSSPWLHFEAGAVWKGVAGARVCPYLVGLEKSDVPYPLAHFQACRANKEETYQLISTVNTHSERPMDQKTLESLFETLWPGLEQHLTSAASKDDPLAHGARSTDEILRELLDTVRQMSRGMQTMSSDLAVAIQEGVPARRIAEHGVLSNGRTTGLEQPAAAYGCDTVSRLVPELIESASSHLGELEKSIMNLAVLENVEAFEADKSGTLRGLCTDFIRRLSMGSAERMSDSGALEQQFARVRDFLALTERQLATLRQDALEAFFHDQGPKIHKQLLDENDLRHLNSFGASAIYLQALFALAGHELSNETRRSLKQATEVRNILAHGSMVVSRGGNTWRDLIDVTAGLVLALKEMEGILQAAST